MVWWCLIWFDDVWWCLMMFDDVWWCLMMFDDVWWCMMMFDDVWWCLMMFDDVWWCLRNANAGLQHKRCDEFLPKFQTLCTGVGDGNTYPRSTGVAVCSMAANLRVMKSFARHCESSVTVPCASRCIMVQTGRTILHLISVQIWHKLDKRNPIQAYIRRPWPSPRQGRRLGPPEVWNLLCHSPLLLRHSSLPLPGFKRFKLLQPSKSLAPPATTLTTLQLLHGFLAAAATKPSGRQPLLLQGCSLPFACTSLAAASTKLLAVSVPASLCLHIALSCYGIRACRLPAFKPLKPLKPSAAASTKPPGLQPALSWPSAFHHCSLPFASLQTPKTPKTLRGSFHQAWPSAFAAPGLQPALSWPSAFQHCSLPFACT